MRRVWRMASWEEETWMIPAILHRIMAQGTMFEKAEGANGWADCDVGRMNTVNDRLHLFLLSDLKDDHHFQRGLSQSHCRGGG